MPNFFKNILEVLRPKDIVESGTQTRRMSNQLIMKELVDHFTDRLEDESVGSRMIYPMSFNILMHPDDYNDRKDSLPFSLPEVINEFYKVMLSKKSKYPTILPSMATEWFFQFAACETSCDDFVGGGSDVCLKIEKGHLAVAATLTTKKLSAGDTSGIVVEENVKASLRTTNSRVGGNQNINWEALAKLEIKAEGTFAQKFDASRFKNDKDVSPSQYPQTQNAPAGTIGELSYVSGGKTIRYAMTCETTTVTNRSDERTGPNFFKIDGEKVKSPHIQIKHEPDTGKFKIVAYAKTRVNGKLMELSNQGELRSYELPTNSDIFISEEISLTFKKI